MCRCKNKALAYLRTAAAGLSCPDTCCSPSAATCGRLQPDTRWHIAGATARGRMPRGSLRGYHRKRVQWHITPCILLHEWRHWHNATSMMSLTASCHKWCHQCDESHGVWLRAATEEARQRRNRFWGMGGVVAVVLR